MTHHVMLVAGAAAVLAARTLGNLAGNAPVTLVEDEPQAPYVRKAIQYLLIGNIDEKGTYLRKQADHFDRLQIKMVKAKALSVQTAQRQVMLDNGETLTFDRLLIATGSSPVRAPVPGIDSPGVHSC